MKATKTITAIALALSAYSAHADRISAEHFGLTAETGYSTAVSSPDKCNTPSKISVTPECSNGTASGYGCHPKYITKCDGNIIGWVEVTLNGADLSDNKGGEGFNVELPMLFNSNSTVPATNSESINIYTCGHSRDSDLAKDTRVQASRDVIGDTYKLLDLMRRKAKFKIQLFYNEYILSGKCIGAIQEIQ